MKTLFIVLISLLTISCVDNKDVYTEEEINVCQSFIDVSEEIESPTLQDFVNEIGKKYLIVYVK